MHQDVPVLIIDSLMLFREGLRRIVYEGGFQCVWCDDHAPVSALRALPRSAAPLLIISTEPDEAAILIGEVRKLHPACRVILLLSNAGHDRLIAARHSGADKMLLKTTSCETLLSTIKLMTTCVTVLPSDQADALPETAARPGSIDLTPEMGRVEPEPASVTARTAFGLSQRELAVLRRLRDGSSNKEIGRSLGITEATVKVHVKAIRRKAGVRNRTQAAVWSSRLDTAPGLHSGALESVGA
jgi:two-component system nitrate/nitrite response regulator NarL